MNTDYPLNLNIHVRTVQLKNSEYQRQVFRSTANAGSFWNCTSVYDTGLSPYALEKLSADKHKILMIESNAVVNAMKKLGYIEVTI